jgi:hypothetical protein
MGSRPQNPAGYRSRVAPERSIITQYEDDVPEPEEGKMQQLLGVAAWVVAAGGLFMILLMVAGPMVRRQVIVLRLRRGLRRIDDVLAEWQRDGSGGRRSPYDSV